jgi:hypothetical protein
MVNAKVGAGLLLLLFLAGTATPQATQAGPGTPTQGQVEAKKPSLTVSVSKKVPVCDDGEFLRRVMLDLVGYPPNLDQVKAFMADQEPTKRIAKVAELLNTDDWADYWSRRFMEVFFGNYHKVTMDTMPKVSDAAAARIVADFQKWLKMKLAKDRPWSEIVAEMLDARGSDEGDPALAYKLSFFNEEGAVPEFANNVSRHLLGIRLLCAKCHDHPFDQWTVVHFYGLAAFNARVRARAFGGSGQKDSADHVEVKYVDEGEVMINNVEIDSDIVKKSKAGGTAAPIFLFGGAAPPGPGVDRIKILVPLMTGKGNTQLRKAVANRVWSWLFGRGIVNPVDDFSFRNKAVIGALEPMVSDMIANKDSIKRLVMGICCSDAYQLTCEGGGGGKVDFGSGSIFPLNGEQLINSAQVATKGRPDRSTGQQMQMVASLFAAGAIWCETTPLPGNARQALLMRNNSEIMGWIGGGGILSKVKGASGGIDGQLDDLFLAVLSRKPRDTERARYKKFIETHPGSGWEDAMWTLINSAEFVTRH